MKMKMNRLQLKTTKKNKQPQQEPKPFLNFIEKATNKQTNNKKTNYFIFIIDRY